MLERVELLQLLAHAFERPLAEIERAGAIVLVGCNPRLEAPILGHKVRQAWKRGAKVVAVNSVDFPFAFEVAHRFIAEPWALAPALAGLVKAARDGAGGELDAALADVVGNADANDGMRAAIATLRQAGSGVVLFGEAGVQHPAASLLRALAKALAVASGFAYDELPSGANAIGLAANGVLPGGNGLNAAAMLARPRKAVLLYGAEAISGVMNIVTRQEGGEPGTRWQLESAVGAAHTAYASDPAPSARAIGTTRRLIHDGISTWTTTSWTFIASLRSETVGVRRQGRLWAFPRDGRLARSFLDRPAGDDAARAVYFLGHDPRRPNGPPVRAERARRAARRERIVDRLRAHHTCRVDRFGERSARRANARRSGRVGAAAHLERQRLVGVRAEHHRGRRAAPQAVVGDRRPAAGRGGQRPHRRHGELEPEAGALQRPGVAVRRLLGQRVGDLLAEPDRRQLGHAAARLADALTQRLAVDPFENEVTTMVFDEVIQQFDNMVTL